MGMHVPSQMWTHKRLGMCRGMLVHMRKRMHTPMHMICACICACKPLIVQIVIKFVQDLFQIQLKWSQHGAKMKPKCICGPPWRASERPSAVLMPQNVQNEVKKGAKMEPKCSQN